MKRFNVVDKFIDFVGKPKPKIVEERRFIREQERIERERKRDFIQNVMTWGEELMEER